jgi:hypothetical protein
MLESVVIDDCDLMGSVGFPAETDTPLVVDADGILAFAIPFESFQAVARRDGEVLEFGDGMDLCKFAQCDTLKV